MHFSREYHNLERPTPFFEDPHVLSIIPSIGCRMPFTLHLIFTRNYHVQDHVHNRLLDLDSKCFSLVRHQDFRCWSHPSLNQAERRKDVQEEVLEAAGGS